MRKPICMALVPAGVSPVKDGPVTVTVDSSGMQGILVCEGVSYEIKFSSATRLSKESWTCETDAPRDVSFGTVQKVYLL